MNGVLIASVSLGLGILLLTFVLLCVKIHSVKISNTNSRLELLRRVTYDAIALASEESARKAKTGDGPFTAEEKHACALEYIKLMMPLVKKVEADKVIRSICAKLLNEGATGMLKVQV